MGPDPVFGFCPNAGFEELGRAVYQLPRQNLVFQNLLVVVDVVDEHVQRRQALCQTLFHHPPLLQRDDPGDDIHRPGAIDVFTVTVDRKADTHFLDGEICRLLPGQQVLDTHFARERNKAARGGPGIAG